jgi:hypothetical protein
MKKETAKKNNLEALKNELGATDMQYINGGTDKNKKNERGGVPRPLGSGIALRNT